jgi:soluble lytic murein transglycosylase-like protein
MVVLAGVGLAGAAWAQTGGELPRIDERVCRELNQQTPSLHDKFKLSSRSCDTPASSAGAAPIKPRQAQQLYLYDSAGAAAASPPPATPSASWGAPMSAPAARRKPGLAAPSTPVKTISRSSVTRALALAPTVDAAARDHDIDPLLLHAIAHVESRHNPVAVSHAGARGVMQVMPGTGQRFGVGTQQLHHAPTNVQVSAVYLKTLQRRFGNNLPLVLAAYNAGEGAVEKYGRRIPPYRETQGYVRQVLAEYERLRQARGVAVQAAGQGAAS